MIAGDYAGAAAAFVDYWGGPGAGGASADGASCAHPLGSESAA